MMGGAHARAPYLWVRQSSQIRISQEPLLCVGLASPDYIRRSGQEPGNNFEVGGL